jgi:group I intron endonuclease
MDKCGIYQIRNSKNNKIYIGQSINIPSRIKNHKSLLRDGKHHSHHLQNSYNKYGVGCFEFKTLLLCEQSELTRYEQALVNSLSPQYNKKLECVDSPKGIKLRESTKLKMSLSHKGSVVSRETRERISIANKGRKVSDETRKKLSLNSRFKGKHHTDEWKRNMSEKMKGRKKSPEHIRKVALANLGKHNKPLSKEHREKVSGGLRYFYSKNRMVFLSKEHLENMVALAEGLDFNRDVVSSAVSIMKKEIIDANR